MPLAEDIILKKRDGSGLTTDEIKAFVTGVVRNEISDAQIAAFTMATWFRGMAVHEQMALTLAMRDSGKILEWPDLDGPVLDKHSTGGVGDLVSLVLGPVVAACGGYVPMISGRGLGHTGGTLDKLESIPGFDVSPGLDEFQRLVRRQRLAIIGQTDELAPADRRFYAVRDVTATVSSTPLIVSSILSKKLAEGLDALVMDIKFGSGAFQAGPSEAEALADEITRVACEAGVPCNALITDMDQPLSWSAGNALEVHEAIRFLRGDAQHDRLRSVVLALSGELLFLGGLAASPEEGHRLADESLASGRAAEQFSVTVAGQGGPASLLDDADRILPVARIVRPVFSDLGGYIRSVDKKAMGTVVVELGGGRRRVEDAVDPAVGISSIAEPGCPLDESTPLAVIHAADEKDWETAAARLRSAFAVTDEPPETRPVLRGKVEGKK